MAGTLSALIFYVSRTSRKLFFFSCRLTSGTARGYPWWSQSLSLDFPWSCLILFDRVQASRGCSRRNRTELAYQRDCPDRSQLHVLSFNCTFTCVCPFVAPTLQLLTATVVRSTCHLHSGLSPFLPSLMFKHSLQLWCLFLFVHSFSGGAECFTVRRFERERQDALRTE